MSIPLRVCQECGVEAYALEELDYFATNFKSKFGKKNLCKKCAVKSTQQYRKENIEIVRRKNRKYMELYYPAHKLERLAYVKEYQAKNVKKIQAQTKTRRVPTAPNCSKCDISNVRLERHHPDYNKPDFFVTLCVPCHRQVHKSLVGEEAKTT